MVSVAPDRHQVVELKEFISRQNQRDSALLAQERCEALGPDSRCWEACPLQQAKFGRVQTCRREAEKQHLIEQSATAVERIGAMIDTLDDAVRRVLLEAA